MASSSSSSTGTGHASSSQTWIYDVFLSFRGEDIRKTFVDHLYSSLKQRLIHTYKDDIELPRGELIGPSLMKAITGSKISVIIFSKNYAESSWCMDELAYIMKCRDERGQLVMPVFYDVEPSYVRNQEGEYGKALAKHEVKNVEKAKIWKKALVDASNLAGWALNHIASGHESQGIKQIVDDLTKKLLPSNSHINDDLVGMGSRLQDLKSRLKISSGGVRMVGIWGIGGSGKTTLASSLYREISQNFDGHYFVDNIREKSSTTHGLEDLQEKLLSKILKTEITVEGVIQGRHELKNRLQGSKVLILLDDVDDLKQLEALAGSHDWFGYGSRILITTRDQHLLRKHKVDEIYPVMLLNQDEAIQLFNKHAYQENNLVEDYETLSVRVVSYAAGLPLALKVLGSFLYGRDKNEWMGALARLEDNPEMEIIEKLKISYDGLKQVEKELFLDIACFFRGQSKVKTMEILDARGFHPSIGLAVLIERALLTIVGDNLDMHDQIQEMGHYIVRREHPSNPQKHRRVWRSQEIEDMCFGDAKLENNSIEAIKYTGRLSGFPRLVSNMKKLRLLIYVDSPAESNIIEVEGPNFLSNELQYIYWREGCAGSYPKSFQPMKLVVLSLHCNFQRELWKGYKYLPNLRKLELRSLLHLIKTPDFDGLPNLERFILYQSPHLLEIHPSFGRLERLVYVVIQGCYNIQTCPPITRSKKLETIVFSGCEAFFRVSDIQLGTGNLRYLHLDKNGVLTVSRQPGGHVFKFQAGQDCASGRCEIAVHDKIKQHLRSLFVSFLAGYNIIDGHTTELCLEEASLPHNNITKHIGFYFCQTSIRKLDLRWCNLVDANICSDVVELPNLQELDLRGNTFSQLNFNLLRLPKLKWIDVSSCRNLVKLSELPSSIAVLIAENCCSLEIVDGFSKCKWLWKVSLMGENKLGLPAGDLLLDTMFQGNAVEQHFISFSFTYLELWKGFVRRQVWGKEFTLQLPNNWDSNYSGFLITTVSRAFHMCITMIIKQELDEHSQSGLQMESNAAPEPDCHSTTTYVGYVSFTTLRDTTWLKSANNRISFSIASGKYDHSIIVELVPKNSKGDPMKQPNVAKDFSEFWRDPEDSRTFSILDDSDSSVKILWRPCYWQY